MKMIIGLGNPGNRYAGTRHNAGFDVIDHLLDEHHLSMTDQKFQADYTVWHHPNGRVMFVKPYTYMNLSGEAILPLMSYYGVAAEDILVIYDDLDLEPGRIRLRYNGSSGGHNGMKSIIDLLGTQDFYRIRVGIGRPAPGWKVVDHVLSPFTTDERIEVDNAIDKAVQAVDDWIETSDFNGVMNRHN